MNLLKERDPLISGGHDEGAEGEARSLQAVTHLKPFAGANAATPAHEILVHKRRNGLRAERPLAKGRRIGVIGGMQVNEEKLERVPGPLKRVHEALTDEIGPKGAIVPLERGHEIHRLGSGRRHGNQRGRGGARARARGRAQAHEAERVGEDASRGPKAQADRAGN